MWQRRVICGLAAILLAACQPVSSENKLLQESGDTLEDPNFYPSDGWLRHGKVSFKNGDFGKAEYSFRKAVEQTPKDREAWLGLAASYDQLRRFDMADTAYEQVYKLGKNDAVTLNNVGYSMLLRGNLSGARKFLLRAYELDPENPYIVHNIELLGESGKQVKRT
jgi:Flp pilus assembly protein TadD